ncbi:hypothetical protein [Dyella humicola]|uniref:hypothetical protein n=1 Tax=Dyella humicola TaxID=2992126 RepID=UPI002258FC52|nr:hypothetical protein [Dyella humicola]
MIFIRRFAAVAAVLACTLSAGCAMTSKVVPVGHGQYTVNATASPMRGGSGGARAMAFDAANDFCTKKGQQPEVSNSGTDTLNGFGAGSADLTFRCVDK